MPRVERISAFLRFELADARRSRWALFTTLAYGGVFGLFVWFGLRESTVLGFTGLSRVVLNLSNAVVLVVPLVALVATSQSVVRARAGGTFELLLVQPAGRSDWLVALLMSRLVVLLGPLLVLLAIVCGVSAFQTGPDATLSASLRTLAVAGSLTWAFLGVGILLSVIARTAERAIVYALVAFTTVAALHDFALLGVLLRFELPPVTVFALAAANPVQAARLAILSGVDPELSILGPVGFWLATHLGPRLSLLVGIGWPLLLGTTALLGASRRFHRGDLVA